MPAGCKSHVYGAGGPEDSRILISAFTTSVRSGQSWFPAFRSTDLKAAPAFTGLYLKMTESIREKGAIATLEGILQGC